MPDKKENTDFRETHAITAGDPIAPKCKAGRVGDELPPSIRKEYHHSFLQIFLWFSLIWVFVILILVMFAAFGG